LYVLSVVCGSAPDTDLGRECCGRFALGMAVSVFDPGYAELPWEDLLPSSHAPFSLADLERAARQIGLDALAVQWDDLQAADLSCACILHVRHSESSTEPDHFVTCFGSDRSAVLLADYPKMPVWVSREKLHRHWSGTALYLGRPGDPQLNRLRWQIRLAALRRPVGALLLFGCVAGAWLALRRPSRRNVIPGTAVSAGETAP
jgi:ABC-type bacteriocin/lantibiotic exporter with double-glycine peptidase domain